MTERAPRRLADLGLAAKGAGDTRITGLSVDSRLVQPGHLFAALPGTKLHGGEFIRYAIRMGAGAILTDRIGAEIAKAEIEESGIPVARVEDPRQALAHAAAIWFRDAPKVIAAVTGTNGKTSVASFTRQIWQVLGHPAINLGTTGVEGDWSAPLHHTTPEPITLHRMLADAVREGITHTAMEASSHGLAQKRLDGVTLTAAAFTNITQDHLDYHEDFEDYFEAKLGLFERVLPEDGTAVINLDDPRGAEVVMMAESRGQDVLTVGAKDGADLHILAQRFESEAQILRFSFAGQTHQARLGLIGGFQASNALVAAGLAIACGAEPRDVFNALEHLTTVRGRMQHVATRENGGAVFVDYAHTPDAVKTALTALRPHVLGRIVVVFGAGGDRDPGKRPMMGAAAARGADLAIVTDDNPRSEDPAAIRAAVLDGMSGEYVEVGDRAEAILRGVDALGPGDALLIAGKGHETGQIIGDDVLPFDDAEQASVAVAALDGRLA